MATTEADDSMKQQPGTESEDTPSAPDDSGESRLLSLPPEIRNMIYRDAVVKVFDYIPPGQFPVEPPLLSVNRQIRAEALPIYYGENRFLWHVAKFNADTHIAWCRLSRKRLRTKSAWRCNGSPNWSNLLRWLKAFYDGDSKAPGEPANMRAKRNRKGMSSKFFEMMARMKKAKLSWHDIRANLEIVKDITCLFDYEWEKHGSPA